MNMMTQEVDPDLEMLTQLPTPVSCNKGGSKRGCNYNHDEDIQLCVSCMNISNDPVVGNDHTAKSIGQELLIIKMRTRPPALKGLPVLLNTDGKPYRNNV
jgi:hypothetical protein